MPTEKTRSGLWLAMWAYMVITLVAPLALATTGVWDWDIGMAVGAAFWAIAFIFMHLASEWRPTSRPKGRRRETRPNAEDDV